MNIKKSFLITIALLFLVGISSCGLTNSGNSADKPIIVQITTPSLSQIPTLIPQQTSTITINPTSLSSDELDAMRHKGIVTFMEKMDCILPCLGGITPGNTTWAVADGILEGAGIIVNENTLSPGLVANGWKDFSIAGTATIPGGILQTDLNFYNHEGIVDHIIINSSDIHSPPSPTFSDIWMNYAPEKILPELGVPSRIEIFSELTPGEGVNTGSSYDIYLFYDAKGILLEYRFIDDLNTLYKICPIFGDGGNAEGWIKMILKSSNDGVPIEEYEPAFNSTFVDLEVAAGMSNEEFYKLFLQAGKPPCFNMLPSILPQP
jgi:hypothetical protein